MDESLCTGTAAGIAETFESDKTVLKLHGSAGTQVDLTNCTSIVVMSEHQREWAEDWHSNELSVERSLA